VDGGIDGVHFWVVGLNVFVELVQDYTKDYCGDDRD
jgi:hypothetical protein